MLLLLPKMPLASPLGEQYLYLTSNLSPAFPLWIFSWFLLTYTQTCTYTHTHTHEHMSLWSWSPAFFTASRSYFIDLVIPQLSLSILNKIVGCDYFLVHFCISQIIHKNQFVFLGLSCSCCWFSKFTYSIHLSFSKIFLNLLSTYNVSFLSLCCIGLYHFVHLHFFQGGVGKHN